MKKKLLYISTRYPYDNSFSGDRQRTIESINFFSKYYDVILVCLGNKNYIQENKLKKRIKIIIFEQNFISKIFFSFLSILKNKPIQFGFFFSSKLKYYIQLNAYKFDIIIFNTIRTCQYLPTNYSGVKYLDMIDLISSNYYQTYKKLNLINPLKYIYLYEYKKIFDYEKKIQNYFKKIFLVSKKDLKLASQFINSKKLIFLPMGINKVKNIFKYNKKNNKIIFIGNLKYLPNMHACLNFIKEILPILVDNDNKILFYIIGEINFIDKVKINILTNKYKNNIKVLGKINNLEKYIKKSFCAICNTEIASGFQTKILTYMSYGIPSIVSRNTMVDKKIINRKNILSFKNNKQFINLILELKNNKTLADKISKNGIELIEKNFFWNKVFKNKFK